MVTVAHARADEPAFVAVVADIFVADRTEHPARVEAPGQHPAPVVSAAERVEPHEMPRKPGAAPPADLRLDEPVFHLPVLRKGPRIVVPRNVQRPTARKAELHAQIQRRGRVVKQVGFDRRFLRIRPVTAEAYRHKDQHQSFSHFFSYCFTASSYPTCERTLRKPVFRKSRSVSKETPIPILSQEFQDYFPRGLGLRFISP